jgi:hypothetical protein
LPQFIVAAQSLLCRAAIFLLLNANCSQPAKEWQMKAQNSSNRTWAMVSDFSEIAVLGLCTGLVFSVVAASLVVVVTTLR